MNKGKTISIVTAILNILLVCGMVIHVGVSMYMNEQDLWETSPSMYRTEVYKAVFYMVPFLIINIGRLVFKEKKTVDIVVATLNILLVCAMVIHVGISIYMHAQHSLTTSAPVYIEIYRSIFYMVPFLIINIGNLIVNIVKKQIK